VTDPLEIHDHDLAALPQYAANSACNPGIVRLLPREKYDGKLSIRGGGAYYSFVRLTHEYGLGSDIGLEQNYLSVGFAGCDFGDIVSLGSISLNSVSENNPALQYLVNFKPADHNEPEIRKQQMAARGIVVNGFKYDDRVNELAVGQTFGLRSINFDESDVLVAFKIVRFGKDGSVILAWKKLKTFPTPSCYPLKN
jgi:hypothetical protein